MAVVVAHSGGGPRSLSSPSFSGKSGSPSDLRVDIRLEPVLPKLGCVGGVVPFLLGEHVHVLSDSLGGVPWSGLLLLLFPLSVNGEWQLFCNIILLPRGPGHPGGGAGLHGG